MTKSRLIFSLMLTVGALELTSCDTQPLPKIELTALLVNSFTSRCEITIQVKNHSDQLVNTVFVKATSADANGQTTGSSMAMITNIRANGATTDQLMFPDVQCADIAKLTNVTIYGDGDDPVDTNMIVGAKTVIPIEPG